MRSARMATQLPWRSRNSRALVAPLAQGTNLLPQPWRSGQLNSSASVKCTLPLVQLHSWVEKWLRPAGHFLPHQYVVISLRLAQ